MESTAPSVALEQALNLNDVLKNGSILHINEEFEIANNLATEKDDILLTDSMGHPVKSFKDLEEKLSIVDDEGLVKKKIIEEGGGLPLSEEFTVSIAFSGYWENETKPFDVVNENKPLVVDLNDNGLLPGLQIAIKTLLVGELSIFLLSYKVMYGEFGIPPRIKPKANCVFYIKLLKSIITPTLGPINFSAPNMFQRVHHEVKLLYSCGTTLYKSNNYSGAIKLFRKSLAMLHKCRLADENEENIQEKLLIKLYTNLALCYNKTKQPLKACTACNELNRLNSLWNNSKVLFQNAKALRMMGEFGKAGKKIRRALKLNPNNEEIKAELDLLQKTHKACNQTQLVFKEKNSLELMNDKFKQEVESLIQYFKNNDDLCKLTLPCTLNSSEIDYIKTICTRENIFFNKIQKSYLLDKDTISSETNEDDTSCSLFDNDAKLHDIFYTATKVD
ncbi:inactive peptidyl-prolyl cis-trans isomerase shutdown-like [Battus philenor]|uniref:inactive peptidyl-prolyl cis-trans isomerase shutdown-like n=1 Tax=Battus philenor TaxID=42288 RepID=UPI0035CF369C